MNHDLFFEITFFSKVIVISQKRQKSPCTIGKILGLSELDYDAQLIHSIPKSYRSIMFHDKGGFQYSSAVSSLTRSMKSAKSKRDTGHQGR